MLREEITRRLRKKDYIKLPKVLEIDGAFDNITSTQSLKDMLLIADTCGMKYLEFYQSKDDIDIEELITQLNPISYHPNIPYIEGQGNVVISKLSVDGNNFEVLANFYSMNEEWVISEDGRHKELEEVHQRRVLHLKYIGNSNKLIVSIDPIGDGAKISEDIHKYINTIFTDLNINFYEYFELISISHSIYNMNDNQLVRPHRLKTINENVNRTYDAIAKNPQDSLSDEPAFQEARSNELNLEKMRLSYLEYNINIELFSDDLLKIWSKANWEEIEHIKDNIIRYI